MSRRLLVSVIAGLAVVVGAAIVLGLRPAPRFVYGVVAAGPGEALLLTRRNEDDDTKFWLELVDLRAPLRWSAALTPIEPDEALGFSSVAADETRVIVRGSGPDHDVALALDRATGDRVWTTLLPAAPTTDTRIATSVVIDGPRVILARQLRDAERPTTRLDALAVADGALLWSHTPDRDGDIYLPAPGRLLLSNLGGGSVVLDSASGQPITRIEGAWARCPLPTGVLIGDFDAYTIVSAEPPRPLALAPAWRPGDGPCGARGGDLVVGARSTALDAAGVLRLDPRTGQARWQADLGDQRLEPMLTVDGRLPRFLPVVMSDNQGDAPRQGFAIVDLDTGAVVRRGDLGDHAHVIATAERAWIWLPYRGLLVGIDPASGAYASATRFTGITGGDVRREDVRFGALWLFGMGWARPDALAWASVDLASGAVLRTCGEVVAEDVTAAQRAAFGG